MKIYIGADHRGFALKKHVTKILEDLKYDIVDMGVCQKDKVCDYPLIAQKVGRSVARSKTAKGILICMSGLGQTIAANKVRGAYAALCYNATTAKLSRLHNNANILVLAAKFVKQKDLKKILVTWLKTEFEAGRHLRRFNQIKKIEKG